MSRVTFYAGPETSAADVETFLGTSPAVVAVEAAWLERLRSCRLHCYYFLRETFECVDECAGYFVSRVPVVPARIEVIDDPIAELLKRGVELRFMPNLGALRDAVVSSSLQFSLIRMRNALPRVTVSQKNDKRGIFESIWKISPGGVLSRASSHDLSPHRPSNIKR
jgi:hypothetical protein